MASLNLNDNPAFLATLKHLICSLCKFSVKFQSELTVEGTLGIRVDKTSVLFLHITENIPATEMGDPKPHVHFLLQGGAEDAPLPNAMSLQCAEDELCAEKTKPFKESDNRGLDENQIRPYHLSESSGSSIVEGTEEMRDYLEKGQTHAKGDQWSGDSPRSQIGDIFSSKKNTRETLQGAELPPRHRSLLRSALLEALQGPVSHSCPLPPKRRRIPRKRSQEVIEKWTETCQQLDRERESKKKMRAKRASAFGNLEALGFSRLPNSAVDLSMKQDRVTSTRAVNVTDSIAVVCGSNSTQEHLETHPQNPFHKSASDSSCLSACSGNVSTSIPHLKNQRSHSEGSSLLNVLLANNKECTLEPLPTCQGLQTANSLDKEFKVESAIDFSRPKLSSSIAPVQKGSAQLRHLLLENSDSKEARNLVEIGSGQKSRSVDQIVARERISVAETKSADSLFMKKAQVMDNFGSANALFPCGTNSENKHHSPELQLLNRIAMKNMCSEVYPSSTLCNADEVLNPSKVSADTLPSVCTPKLVPFKKTNSGNLGTLMCPVAVDRAEQPVNSGAGYPHGDGEGRLHIDLGSTSNDSSRLAPSQPTSMTMMVESRMHKDPVALSAEVTEDSESCEQRQPVRRVVFTAGAEDSDNERSLEDNGVEEQKDMPPAVTESLSPYEDTDGRLNKPPYSSGDNAGAALEGSTVSTDYISTNCDVVGSPRRHPESGDTKGSHPLPSGSRSRPCTMRQILEHYIERKCTDK